MKMATQSEHKSISSFSLGKIDSQRLLVILRRTGQQRIEVAVCSSHVISAAPSFSLTSPSSDKTTSNSENYSPGTIKIKSFYPIVLQQDFFFFYKEMRILEIQAKSWFAACIGFANICSGIITQQQSNTVPMVF